MKKLATFIVSILYVLCLTAQNAVDYRNENLLPCDSTQAKFICETEFVDSTKLYQIRCYTPEKRLVSVVHYADSACAIRQGFSTFYHYNGVIQSQAFYVEGILHGTVVCRYSNGNIRRQDEYYNGKLIEGKCFAANGMQVRYFPFERPANYMGGVSALYTAISANSQQVELPQGEQVSGVVQVLLTINAKGRIVEKQIIQSLHPAYDAEVLRICSHLGKFEPAERDGESVVSTVVLPIRF